MRERKEKRFCLHSSGDKFGTQAHDSGAQPKFNRNSVKHSCLWHLSQHKTASHCFPAAAAAETFNGGEGLGNPCQPTCRFV